MAADALLRHPAASSAARPRLYHLAAEVVVAVWDEMDPARTGRLVAHLDGRIAPAPVSIISLSTVWGGIRRVVLLRWRGLAHGDGVLSIQGTDGKIAVELRAAGGSPEPLDAAALLGGLDPNGQTRVVRQVLEFARSAFSLQDDPAFVASCRSLLRELSPRPRALTARVHLTSRLVLCEGMLPAAFGRTLSAAFVGRGAVRAVKFHPAATGAARRGRIPVHMVIDRAAGEGTIIALFGEAGLACRSVEGMAEAPGTFVEWLERRPRVPTAVREYVAACLMKAAEDPEAIAVLRELQVLVPLPRRQASGPDKPIAADVEHAISAGSSGVFVSGWLHDPHGLVEKVVAVSPVGTRRPVPIPTHRFPRKDIEKRLHKGSRAGIDLAPGFVTFLPEPLDAIPTVQYRFEFLLRSGAKVDVVPAPAAPSLVEQRAAVLGSIPGHSVTPAILSECIAPAVAPLHKAYMETSRPPDVVAYGPPIEQPEVSVIVPLYRNLEFIRFQMGAFAIDPEVRRNDLIFVLDSPEQRLQVEHLLLGLYGLYGFPFRLAVMSGNYGYAAANNHAAQLARGKYLVMLNSDVVPDRPGWISALRAEFSTDAVGIAGAKLLFEDGALQHAGMYFGRDLKGEWLNQHYFKGFPRNFGPAGVARSVPAVTGACLMIERALFEKVGGFTEDFVIGDYEDSDLCLKVRQAGFDIRYTPNAELYHFERRSISQHGGYMRSVAAEYNRWLHSLRWSDAMHEIMARASSAQRGPVHSPRTGDARRGRARERARRHAKER